MDIEPRTAKEPRDLYGLIYPLAKLALDHRYNLNVINPENILSEPTIYAANHIEFADSLLLTEAVTEETGVPLRMVMKDDYAKGMGIDNKGKYGRAIKYVVNHTLQIPVSREGNSRESYQEFEDNVGRALYRGDNIGIHPPGTRTDQDGTQPKYKPGAARLAMKFKVPIVSVGIGGYHLNPETGKIDVDFTFTQPIMPEDVEHLPYSAIPGVKYKSEYMTQVLENRAAQATGLRQTGVFATLRKFRQPNNHE